MVTIAHPPVQCPERTASAVLFLLLLSAGMATQAQQAVYRCGQEYTNAPREPGLCEPLAQQAITVINGTRPAPSPAAAPTAVSARSTKPDPGVAEPASPGPIGPSALTARTPDVQQSERDAQARTILTQELDKARAQLVQLLQSYNHGEPEKWATETRHHQKYLGRVADMKAAIERTERDIDSLQRELVRRTVQTSRRTP
jgi:hypothetical protein